MATTLEYDDEELQRLFAEMAPKQRLKALKGAFRREANRVRKTAINNLRGNIRSNRDLERGVRALVFKRKAGFRVTVGTKKSSKKAGKENTDSAQTSKDIKKHVLRWLEDGTKRRISKKDTRYMVGGQWRKGRRRGFIKPHRFMQKTANDVRNSVTDSLHNEVRNSIKEVAKKHGCT